MTPGKKSTVVKKNVKVVPKKRKIVKRVGIAAATLLALWLVYHQMSRRKKKYNDPGPSMTPNNRKKWYDSPDGPGGKRKEQKRLAKNVLVQTYHTRYNVLKKGKWKKGNYENRTRHLLGDIYN